MTAVEHDALVLLRQSIAANSPAVPTTEENATSAASGDLSLAKATFLYFPEPLQVSLLLTTPTRFTSSDRPVDLRSIYFAWIKRETAIHEYNAAALALDAELQAEGGAGGKLQNLAFVERLDLITWLEGASEESEYIKALPSDAANAAGAAQTASGQMGRSAPVTSHAARGAKSIDPRLQEIYNGERRMGDRNSVLRGNKPTDFSNVRRIAAQIFSPGKAKGLAPTNAPSGMLKAAPAKRPDPIILLSPSASSLLRMSNIKSFLEQGLYVPADSSISTSSNSATLLNMSRTLPGIDAARPMRFIIVETPEQFRPEYWNRVVAVFTTGQVWQFKSYKWQNATELFRHTLGIYVGWRGDPPPPTVKGWGRGVLVSSIDKWVPGASAGARWRDREVVEAIWKAIETNMSTKGWRRDAGPTAI